MVRGAGSARMPVEAAGVPAWVPRWMLSQSSPGSAESSVLPSSSKSPGGLPSTAKTPAVVVSPATKAALSRQRGSDRRNLCVCIAMLPRLRYAFPAAKRRLRLATAKLGSRPSVDCTQHNPRNHQACLPTVLHSATARLLHEYRTRAHKVSSALTYSIAKPKYRRPSLGNPQQKITHCFLLIFRLKQEQEPAPKTPQRNASEASCPVSETAGFPPPHHYCK